MAVRTRGRKSRRMTGRLAAVKTKYMGEGPKAHGLRRKGRTPGSGAAASPRARGGSRVVPAVQPTRLTGRNPRAGASPTKSLDAMRAAAKSRTSGGSSTPGTGPTPSTTPSPRTRGKSALAASRTGRPPAHGARRQGKTPGSATPRKFERPDVINGGPVGSVDSSPKLKGVKARIGSITSNPKIGARKRGRARSY